MSTEDIKTFRKRRYEKRVLAQALRHKNFIIERLRQDWNTLEKKAKKEQLVRRVKEGGTTAAIVAGKTLLTLLLLGGTLTIAAVAPNVIGAVGRLWKRRTYFHKKNLREEITYLKRNNYVRVKHAEGGAGEEDIETYEIALTEIGTKRAVMRALGELKMPKKERWDRRWRVIVFDIPDRHKSARDGLRQRLKTLGFYRLQDSVFVYPHPCYAEIKFLTSIYNINDYIRIIETDTLIYDDDLKAYFGLK